MIVYAKSRWNRIHFKCSPFDASNVSPYLKSNKFKFFENTLSDPFCIQPFIGLSPGALWLIYPPPPPELHWPSKTWNLIVCLHSKLTFKSTIILSLLTMKQHYLGCYSILHTNHEQTQLCLIVKHCI